MSTDLTTAEQSELDQHELIIERGFKTFLEVGQSLVTIRDKRLYRAKYANFEDYCQERWKFSRQRAYQLMSAAQVAVQMSTIVDIPNESVARQLMRLDKPEYQRAALTVAVATAPQGKLTADWLESTIDVLEDASHTDGLVNTGRGDYAALNAAITNETHQKMIHKRDQITAPKQKPLAVIELPAAALAGIEQLSEQLSNVDDAEMLRVVIYKIAPG